MVAHATLAKDALQRALWRGERVSMTHAADQRAVPRHARGKRAGIASRLRSIVLISALVGMGGTQAATCAASDPQATRQDATRGMPVPTATETATPSLPETQASPGRGEATPRPQPIAAPPVAASASRGVLFRVTPPAPAQLPGEAAQGSGATTTTPTQGETIAPPSSESVRVGPSYLLGTIHFGTPEEQGIDYAAIERTFAEVETFVNEASLDEAWKPDYDAYRWLPVEQPLTAMIGGEQFAKARALLPAVRAQDLDRMKPWSVLALLEARGETGSEATMDARLQRIAVASGKRMQHLESLEEQLRALDCVPATEHARVLDERLRASWILRIESAQAMAWYRARNLDAWLADIDRMEGLSEEAKAIEHRARLCLLEQRNARWIGQLQTLFQDGPCLVAIGAVHLVGPDGLLAALRRDGYTVEAMPL